MISKKLYSITYYASCVAFASSASATSSLPFTFVPWRTIEAEPPSTRQMGDRTTRQSSRDSVLSLPRGGGDVVGTTQEISSGLTNYMKGAKSDTLVLLATTALNSPFCQKLQISPILGFLGLGLLTKTRGWIQDIHTTEMLADLGIVLFLFEMGLHLDFQTLIKMKKDVFGIGLGQFTVTAVVIALLCAKVLAFSTPASIIIGWSLALSSSAFVLQLLKDKKQTETQYGRSSFGTLLLQDLMVVPLLVITPILAGTGGGTPIQAISKASIQLGIALTAIALFGKLLLNPLLTLITSSADNQESLIGLIFSIVFGFSFLTEGLGLSNTLGAFLSGTLIAGTPHRHTVEHAASPFRGILVGIFFLTVGFEIDLSVISTRPLAVLGATSGLLLLKTVLATFACRVFGGLPLSISQRVGLVLSQGGEFAFVAFRTARGLGLLKEEETGFLLTCVALTMACTPALEGLGGRLEERLRVSEEEKEKTE